MMGTMLMPLLTVRKLQIARFLVSITSYPSLHPSISGVEKPGRCERLDVSVHLAVVAPQRLR